MTKLSVNVIRNNSIST